MYTHNVSSWPSSVDVSPSPFDRASANPTISHLVYVLLLVVLSQSDTHKSISSLSDCLTDISLWMKSSKFKLNSDKTEFIIIGTKQLRHKLSNHFPVKLLDNDIYLIVFAI